MKTFFVSCYLLTVGSYLALRGRIPSKGLSKLLRSYFRPRYQGDINDITLDEGLCWKANVPTKLLSDEEGVSRLVLLENDYELGPKSVSHEEIRKKGKGRYSHWGITLYFSTSDNSDPRYNEKHYRVEER